MILKNRLELAKYFAELGFKFGAEIGACFGRYSEILCQNIPGLKLIAVDNWSSKENLRREKALNLSGEEETKKKLSLYDATTIKKNSLDAAENVSDESLDFVFIDADHRYQAVKDDISTWAKKVRRGGIVSGHDYYIFGSGNRGVIDAVDEYTKERGIDLQIIPWDRQNIVHDDRPPCWYFFKK